MARVHPFRVYGPGAAVSPSAAASLSLAPSVEVGLRRDGGDAETGAGMDVSGGLAFVDTVAALSLDVRVRTGADAGRALGRRVHRAGEGVAVVRLDRAPSSPLGLTARVAPSWGGQARGGAEALRPGQMAYGMSAVIET